MHIHARGAAFLFALTLAAPAKDGAATAGVSLRISTEAAPSGGVAQIKVHLTEPKPIIKTKLQLDGLDEDLFEILGIALYSPLGRAWGIARYADGQLMVEASSPQGDLGLSPDYPVLTIAVRVKDSAAGATLPIALDLARSSFLDLLGIPYPAEVKQGAVFVGGTLAVHNVVPGGGRLEAGQTFRILGQGFRHLSRLQVEGAGNLGYQVHSDTVLEIFTPAPLALDAANIRLRNTLGERVQYFSYQRATAPEPSLLPFLNSLVPLLPPVDLSRFELPLPPPQPGAYAAVAFENTHPEPAVVSLTPRSTEGLALTPVVVRIAPHARLVRALAELFPDLDPDTLVALAAEAALPVRALSMSVNERDARVLPLAPLY